jgi:DNA-binding CsgD family transcriptional regulator
MKAAVASPLFQERRSASHETLETGRVSFGAAEMGLDSPESEAVRLTPRQLEVLALLCEGLPNKLICRQLSISAGTVKAHISGILRELGVASRLQAVVAARRCGLVCEGGSAPARAGEESRLAIGSRPPRATITAVDFGQRITHRLNLSQQGR